MSEERMSLSKRILRSLYSPRKNFESIKGNDLGRGLLIIAIIAVVSAWAGYNYSFKLPMAPIPGLGQNNRFQNLDTFRTNMAIIMALGGGIGVVTEWIVLSIFIFLAGRLIIGEGSFRRMLTLTAFSSTPLIMQQVLRLIDSYTVSERILLSMVSAGSSARNLLFSQVLSIFTIFGLWSFAIVMVAVSVIYNTSKKRAFAATLTAYILFILLRTFTPL